MSLFTLLPVGFLQIWDSYENGLWHARSSAFYERGIIQLFGQWRIVPDTIIIIGATCFVIFVIRGFFNLKPVGIKDGDTKTLRFFK